MKRLRSALMIALLTLIGLEVSLSLADPLGVRYLAELDYMTRRVSGPTLSYHYQPGVYDFGNWGFTIDADGLRDVPDSGAGCRLVFFGDSVTFGWGVDSAETFVNLLAQDWPDVTTINAGVPGYNSQQVREAVETTPYDWGVYLVISNDVAPMLDWGSAATDSAYPGFGVLHGGPPALGAYFSSIVHVATNRPETDKPGADLDRFWVDLAAIFVKGVEIVHFGDVPVDVPATQIDKYRSKVSYADGHPDTAGHAMIAEQLRPIVQQGRPPDC